MPHRSMLHSASARSKTRDRTQPRQCPDCLAMISYSNFSRHCRERGHGRSPSPGMSQSAEKSRFRFQCGVCDKKYTRGGSLRRHQEKNGHFCAVQQIYYSDPPSPSSSATDSHASSSPSPHERRTLASVDPGAYASLCSSDLDNVVFPPQPVPQQYQLYCHLDDHEHYSLHASACSDVQVPASHSFLMAQSQPSQSPAAWHVQQQPTSWGYDQMDPLPVYSPSSPYFGAHSSESFSRAMGYPIRNNDNLDLSIHHAHSTQHFF